jgi:phospholipid N-methyltransferase
MGNQGVSGNHNGSNGRPSVLSDFMLFAKNFVKHPNAVGWMLPSSPWVVNDVLKQIDWDRAKVIVEYGPGVGTFTTKLLQRMRPDATLIALEINPDFCAHLRENVKDPRLKLVNESATQVAEVLSRHGFGHADYIISGIPFKTLPHELRDKIVQHTYSVLGPKGIFLVYQLSSAVLPYLEKVFGKVSRETQLLSFIPARLFYCSRARETA